jgi:hypothetical protein
MPRLDPGRPGTKEAYGLSVIGPDGTMKSTTVALSFTPADIGRQKFLPRGLTTAAAHIDRLEVF